MQVLSYVQHIVDRTRGARPAHCWPTACCCGLFMSAALGLVRMLGSHCLLLPEPEQLRKRDALMRSCSTDYA